MIGDFPTRPDWAAPVLDDYDGLLLFRGLTFEEAAVRAGADLVYLATPYSRLAVDDHGAWSVPHSLAAQGMASLWAARFAAAGVSAVAPISLSGDMVLQAYVQDGGPDLDPLDRAFWEAWCRPLLAASRAVVIPPIAGWAESRGVWREALAALGAGKRVMLVGEG